MKELIKKLLKEGLSGAIVREGLLNERLTDVNEDVDLIYDLGFRDDVNKLMESGVLIDNMFQTSNIDTKYLKAELSVKAHKLNPCTIEINNGGNYYKPSDNLISVGVHQQAKELIIDNGGVLNDIGSYLNDDQVDRIKQEFTEGKIKGSIHHELTHWIDDTLNNQHINKTVNSPETMKKINKNNVNSNYIELQAQIHNIVQLKRVYSDTWDNITFKELVTISPTLNNIYKNLSFDIRNEWVRKLKTRMHREGLLGKMMANN